jgi:hypothetical protein
MTAAKPARVDHKAVLQNPIFSGQNPDVSSASAHHLAALERRGLRTHRAKQLAKPNSTLSTP